MFVLASKLLSEGDDFLTVFTPVHHLSKICRTLAVIRSLMSGVVKIGKLQIELCSAEQLRFFISIFKTDLHCSSVKFSLVLICGHYISSF